MPVARIDIISKSSSYYSYITSLMVICDLCYVSLSCCARVDPDNGDSHKHRCYYVDILQCHDAISVLYLYPPIYSALFARIFRSKPKEKIKNKQEATEFVCQLKTRTSITHAVNTFSGNIILHQGPHIKHSNHGHKTHKERKIQEHA